MNITHSFAQLQPLIGFLFCQMMGQWFVVQYYASSEEALEYKCMRAVLSLSPQGNEVSLNFTYSFTDDPDNDLLEGNITWVIPDQGHPAHWVHAEESCE